MKKMLLVVASSAFLLACNSQTTAEDMQVTLYKDPSCGCCGAYADYLDKNGFQVKRIDRNDMDVIKEKLGTHKAASCHTTVIGDYVVEGHVPVQAINKMLTEKPAIHGLSIPGMPMNSPGMGPEKPGSLDILSLDKDGNVTGLYLNM